MDSRHDDELMKATFEVGYDPRTRTLTVSKAFLKNLEKWMTGVGVELIPGRGIPSYVFITLQQLKQMGVPYGGLRHVCLSTIQHVETLIQIAQATRRGTPIERAASESAAVEIASTPLVQSGHRVVPGSFRVVANPAARRPIEWILRNQVELGLLDAARAEALLVKYGVDRSFVTAHGHDIEFDVAPFDEGRSP